jgi:hypothetical protein|tara:strand:- start:79 stop:753 length:675 start_codon:yes stop_codon:yes gene_type:complete
MPTMFGVNLKMKNFTIYFLLIFTIFSCNKTTDKILIHEFTPTASSWNVLKWNTINERNPFQIRETVDSKNRVTKLEFLKNGKEYEDVLCYLPTLVEYEYLPNKIIEKLFINGEQMEATECEMQFKTIYHLDNNYISKVETFRKFDTINFSKKELAELRKYVSEYELNISNDSTNTEIEFYYHSFAKMNGIYPTNKDYKYDPNNYYYGDTPENKSIINGIKKIKN